MKPQYFDQETADADDLMLKMGIMQGYVPRTCLLGGMAVMNEINRGLVPCWGCEGPRDKCEGKPKQTKQTII